MLLAWGGMPAGRFPPPRFIASRLVECNRAGTVSAIPGRAGGSARSVAEGVKLEERVLVTAGGVQRLSLFPFEDDLIV